MRKLEVPGYRVGKVPPELLPRFAARNAGWERRVFVRLIPLWMELSAELVKQVEAELVSVAPTTDATKTDWKDLAALLPTLSAVLTSLSPNEIVLSLFVLRYVRLLDEAPDEKDKGVATDPVGAHAALESAETTSLDDELERATSVLVQKIESLDFANPAWETVVAPLLARVGGLAEQAKHRRRRTADRNALSTRVDALISHNQSELRFLGVLESCESWRAKTSQGSVAVDVLEMINELSNALEDHQRARGRAQNAADDKAFEAESKARAEAKTNVLRIVGRIEPFMSELREPAREELATTECGPEDDTRPLDNEHEYLSVEIQTRRASPFEAPIDTPATLSLAAAKVTHPNSGVPTNLSAFVPPQPALENREKRPRPVVPDVPPATAHVSVGTSEIVRHSGMEVPRYEEFRCKFWVSSVGTIEAPPWRDPSYLERLSGSMDRLLRGGGEGIWRQLVIAKAIRALDSEAVVHPNDVRASAEIWAAPTSPSAGIDSRRATRLRACIGARDSKLALLLEALRPSTEQPLLPSEIDALVDVANFQSGALRVVTQRLLMASALGEDAFAQLFVYESGDESWKARGDSLAQKRSELLSLITKVWSAAGGRIRRTHCRRAWAEFMEGIQPTLTRLYPPPRGDDDWDASQLLQRVEGFPERLEELCERSGARFDDKRQMLRCAGEISDAARRVLNARLAKSGREPGLDRAGTRTIEVEQLRLGELPASEEEWCRKLLLRALERSPADIHPLAITAREIFGWPDILRHIRDVPQDALSEALRSRAPLAYADDLENPTEVAAVVMSSPEVDISSVETLVAALERTGRSFLLASLFPVLDEKKQKSIHAARVDALTRTSALVSRMTEVGQHLAHLGSRHALDLASAQHEAQRIIDDNNDEAEASLFAAWLHHVNDIGERLVEAHVSALQMEILRRENGEDIRAALDKRDYERALRLIYGHAGSETPTYRQTDWRDPSIGLSAKERLKSIGDAKLRGLVDAWLAGLRGDQVRADRTLRTEFARIVFDGRGFTRESTCRASGPFVIHRRSGPSLPARSIA